MALSLLQRLALHPALLLIVVILPFVLLGTLIRRMRPPEDDCLNEEYVLLPPTVQR